MPAKLAIPVKMAYNYGRQQYQQIPEYWAPAYQQRSHNDYQLKPVSYVQTNSVHSGHYDGSYRPGSTATCPELELTQFETKDAKLKSRIRILRAIQRTLAVILSAATFAPLAMTLVKFFQTRNVYFTVDGEQRTAWADGTEAWYTYLYFGVATISLIFDSAILLSYCRGVKQANKASSVAGIWSGILMASHVIVWIISVAIYRYGKEPDVDGKFKDLWGWTCSAAAQEIQSQITDVDYSQYCKVQVGNTSVITRM